MVLMKVLALLIFIKAGMFKEGKFLNYLYPQQQIYNQLQPFKQCECGKINNIMKPKADIRIINGTTVSAHRYPWMVIIYYMNEFICGGSIITDYYILTAAHCMTEPFIKDEMKILLGEHNRCVPNSDTVRFSVSDIIKHSDYNPLTFAYDIMLLRVNMKITFNKFIRPICLPEYDHYGKFVLAKYKGKKGSIVGWGTTNADNQTSDSCEPMEVPVPILGREACPGNADTLFCAGYLNGEADSCQGDSGGPLQIRNKYNKYEIIGVISSGEGCAAVGKPGLYTDVLQILGWIYKHTMDSSCINYPITPFHNTY